jgi:hypothetical protein
MASLAAALLIVLLAGTALGLSGACRRTPPPQSTATVRGRVVSANGRALGEVKLQMLTPDKVARVAREGTTAPDGTFSLAGVAPGKYLLRGQLPGFSGASVPLQLGAGESLATVLRLDPVQLLEGIVQDAEGRPLAQAALFAWPVGGRQVGVVEAATGADGRFALAGLATGSWTVMVEAPGFGTLRLERVDVPARPLVLRLDGEARTLGGMVVGPTGAPVADAQVLLGGPSFATPRAVRSNPKGLFLFHGLGFGRFVLRASGGDLVSQHESVVIDEGTGWLPPAKLTLHAGSRLSGRVVDDRGQPLPRAEVELTAPPAGDAFEIVRSDGEGRFVIGPVAPGRYQVWARLAGHAMNSPSEIDLRAEAVGRIELRLARAAALTGLTLDEDGRPLAGALVTISAQQGLGIQDLAVLQGSLPMAAEAANLPAEALARKGRLRSTASDHLGRFLLADLPPGQFHVEVTGARRIPVRKGPLGVEPGRTADLGRLTLATGLPLSGRIVDESGAPLRGARLQARLMDTAGPSFSGVAGDDGRFVVYVPRGRVSVMASASRRAPSVKDGILLAPGVATPEVELRLHRADATVEGTVRDPQGRPAHRARVLAFPLRKGPGTPDAGAPPDNEASPLAATSTDRAGHFRLSNVPKEPFLVEARHASWPTRSAVATPGQAVYIELPRPGALEGEVRDRSSGSFVSRYRLEAMGPDGRPAVDIRTLGAGFELRGLLPGKWRIRIHAEGYAAAERTVEVPPGASRNEPSVRNFRIDLSRLNEAGSPASTAQAPAAPGVTR